MFNQLPPTSNAHARTWVVEAQAAEITGMSLAWFRKKRQTGGGIKFTKLGKAIKYELADLYEYMDERKVSSVAEYKQIQSGSAD